MLRFKVDVMQMLKQSGYNSNQLRVKKIFGSATMQHMRKREMVSANELEKICDLLQCQPGEILEYVPGQETEDKKAE